LALYSNAQWQKKLNLGILLRVIKCKYCTHKNKNKLAYENVKLKVSER